MPSLSPIALKVGVFAVILSVFLPLIAQQGSIIIRYLIEGSKTGEQVKPFYDVVVGVLSARHHFEYRQALRETWVGYIKQDPQLNKKVLVKFIVGSKACDVHPDNRIDQYSCEKDALQNPVLNEDIIAYQVHHGVTGDYVQPGPIGMDFKVNFPIVVMHLGVFDSKSDGFKTELTVRLYDRVSKTEIVNATFSASDPGELKGGSRFKPVEQFVFPKGFEASIVVENCNEQDPCYDKSVEQVITDSGGGIITFYTVGRSGMTTGTFPENEDTSSQYAATGTFIYQAYASKDGEFSPEGLAKKYREAKEREKEWMKLKSEEETKLKDEINKYNDILLVDVVDVYRNLPHKMMLFYTWVNDNVDFNFTMKTDDDCFVNVDLLLKDLVNYKLHTKPKVWWSRFRQNWVVNHYGKWKDPDYTASVYPAFACGAGNMLSADLVKWLARNAHDLKYYQGEDVSMGIWLSAVGPTLVKDYKWSCSYECTRDMYTLPENDPEELRELWKNLGHCDNPCGCS